jgi:hypothetical protein
VFIGQRVGHFKYVHFHLNPVGRSARFSVKPVLIVGHVLDQHTLLKGVCTMKINEWRKFIEWCKKNRINRNKPGNLKEALKQFYGGKDNEA